MIRQIGEQMRHPLFAKAFIVTRTEGVEPDVMPRMDLPHGLPDLPCIFRVQTGITQMKAVVFIRGVLV